MDSTILLNSSFSFIVLEAVSPSFRVCFVSVVLMGAEVGIFGLPGDLQDLPFLPKSTDWNS